MSAVPTGCNCSSSAASELHHRLPDRRAHRAPHGGRWSARPRPALGDQRTMALFASGPKGYTQGRMTYDLRRLRLKGLLLRLPHSQRYVLTPLGRRVALFMSKSFARLVRPVLQRLDPALPDHPSDPLRRAWRACEQALDCAITEARCRRGLRREARPLTSDLGSRCHFRVARGLLQDL